MRLDNLLHNRKPQSGAVCTGGEKRLEDLFLVRAADAAAVVADFDKTVAPPVYLINRGSADLEMLVALRAERQGVEDELGARKTRPSGCSTAPPTRMNGWPGT